jgi:predicted HTH transcriptional regulator
LVFLPGADLDTPRRRSDLVRALAGLANAKGGHVVLGVDERGRPVPSPVSLDRLAVTALVREVLGEDLGLEFGEVSVGGVRLPTIFLYGADHVVAAAASCGDPEGPRDRYVAEGDVYYRRGAKTLRAGSREFEAIIQKIVSAKDYFKVAGPW